MRNVNRLFLSPNPALEKPRQRPKERREEGRRSRREMRRRDPPGRRKIVLRVNEEKKTEEQQPDFPLAHKNGFLSLCEVNPIASGFRNNKRNMKQNIRRRSNLHHKIIRQFFCYCANKDLELVLQATPNLLLNSSSISHQAKWSKQAPCIMYIRYIRMSIIQV